MISGPKKDEIWTVGPITNLIFIGFGRDFAQEKYFVFQDKNYLFIITKDEFYSQDVDKMKQEDKV